MPTTSPKTSADRRFSPLIAEAIDAIFDIERKNAIAEGERRQERLPDIPWRSIRAMGILIRHGYRRESPEDVWDVIADGDLDALERALAPIAQRPAPTRYLIERT